MKRVVVALAIAAGSPVCCPTPTIEGEMDYVHHRGRIAYGRDEEILYDGDVVYMKIPMPWRVDAPWLRTESDQSDVDVSDVQDRAMRDPLRLLQFLTGASDDVRDVSREDVRGTETTH